MSFAVAGLPPLKISLGSSAASTFEASVPVLAGPTEEAFFGPTKPSGRAGTLALFQHDGWLLGGATLPLTDGLEAATRRVYTDLLQATQGLHLARIWNYVPAINETGPGGLENYRLFSRARSLVFEQHYGPDFKQLLPAASAVGAKSPALTLVFAAGQRVPRHVENPLQVSAYDYPVEFGPRAPSFARATVVPGPTGRNVFISGTAAIRGYATVAPHRLLPQLECTLENLRQISRSCGLSSVLDRGGRSTRHFKVYLRHAADQAAVAEILERELVTKADQVSYLHADICREPLLVEIEATLLGV